MAGLVDYEEAGFLWQVDSRDFTVWMLAFCGTLFFGIEVNAVLYCDVLYVGQWPGLRLRHVETAAHGSWRTCWFSWSMAHVGLTAAVLRAPYLVVAVPWGCTANKLCIYSLASWMCCRWV